jgi:hypothetical protein
MAINARTNATGGIRIVAITSQNQNGSSPSMNAPVS